MTKSRSSSILTGAAIILLLMTTQTAHADIDLGIDFADTTEKALDKIFDNEELFIALFLNYPDVGDTHRLEYLNRHVDIIPVDSKTISTKYYELSFCVRGYPTTMCNDTDCWVSPETDYRNDLMYIIDVKSTSDEVISLRYDVEKELIIEENTVKLVMIVEVTYTIQYEITIEVCEDIEHEDGTTEEVCHDETRTITKTYTETQVISDKTGMPGKYTYKDTYNLSQTSTGFRSKIESDIYDPDFGFMISGTAENYKISLENATEDVLDSLDNKSKPAPDTKKVNLTVQKISSYYEIVLIEGRQLYIGKLIYSDNLVLETNDIEPRINYTDNTVQYAGAENSTKITSAYILTPHGWKPVTITVTTTNISIDLIEIIATLVVILFLPIATIAIWKRFFRQKEES